MVQRHAITGGNLIATTTGGTPLFAAVPIPGAVWLLGSGLLVFAGFRKKIKKCPFLIQL